DVPLHFSRFVPMYKLQDVPRTPAQTLEEARTMALDAGLKYVYIGNLAPHEGNHTYCPSCSHKVIERLGFQVTSNTIRRGKCDKCGARLAGVWS
ncbi:MAG: hypothetical protein KAS72_09840, partial [Phycisphaerales bacterium]|nr:hypothetical protein [Phycisphaerales bacterium]